MKIFYKYLAAAMLIVSIQACKKELGALPKNAKVDEVVVVDQGTAQIALNGVYYTFANATNIKTGWQYHEIRPAIMAGYIGYGYGILPDENNNNAGVEEYWTESYQLLNAANGLIKGINTVADNKFTSNRKKEILGEVHFLRAYAHFKLLTYYAEWYKPNSALGVLLRDELSTTSNITKTRSTVAESYSFILGDLDDAIANAPAVNPNYYVTKWAAMVLKMRVLMSRGAASDYSVIISLANTIMTSGPYLLEANTEDIFHSKGLSSNEVILGIKPQALQASDPYNKSRQYWPGASRLWVAKEALKDLYQNDPRVDWMIGSATDLENSYYFSKFYKENTSPSDLSETDYAIRLTEVYLLEAEAIIKSGGSLAEAKSLIHIVQSKAGITAAANSTHYTDVENAASADLLLVELYKETARNLVGEDGLEWMALARLPFTAVQQLRPTISSQIQFIFAVPVDEFRYNPLFGEQNPGYSKN